MMKYEVKQACAVMLCVSMILGNIASTVVAADQNTDKPYEFELKGTELYGALQDAIANDRIADQDWKFQGLAEADYQSLFEKEGDLYQLKPELDQDSAVKLQIYARLTNDIPVDDMYVVDGSEEFYFFLTNESKLERKVVISVDEKHTEVINVAPKSAVEMSDADAYLTAGDLKPGEAGGTVTAGGGSGNGGSGGGSGSGGSSSGGSGSGESADGTVTDESQNPDSDKVPGEGDAGTDETGGDTGENGGDAGTDETGGNTG
ncbi:MAG: hypothetical protein Q4F28_15210, partial [Eubacteriales bacterium]|nr:hypothetical protein [Eubacteriales bacterium]